MATNNKVYTLVTLLAVILALMGVIFVIAGQDKVTNTENVTEKKLESVDFIEISGEVAKPSTRTNIVTEDYVRDLDGDANLVVMTKDGSAYAVQGGNFLVADRLVTIDEDGKKVYYVNDPKKSVATE